MRVSLLWEIHPVDDVTQRCRYSTPWCTMTLQLQFQAFSKGKPSTLVLYASQLPLHVQAMSLKPSLFTNKLRPAIAPHQHSSLLLRRPLLKSTASRPLTNPSRTFVAPIHRTFRPISTIPSRRMSFSNTDTGNKPADPYKAKNFDEPQLKEKIEDLVSFIEACKFGMMTTRIASTGLLVSRCMALAGKVSPSTLIQHFAYMMSCRSPADPLATGRRRRRPPLPHQHRIRQNRRSQIRPQN